MLLVIILGSWTVLSLPLGVVVGMRLRLSQAALPVDAPAFRATSATTLCTVRRAPA